MSETIKVSRETKQSLVRVAARLQEKAGKRIDLDEAIQYLISSTHVKEGKPEILDEVFGSVPTLSIRDLRSERRLDELMAARKYRS